MTALVVTVIVTVAALGVALVALYVDRRAPRSAPVAMVRPHWRRPTALLSKESRARLNQIHTSNVEEIDVETPAPSRNWRGRGLRKATLFPVEKTPAHLQALAPMRHDSHLHDTVDGEPSTPQPVDVSNEITKKAPTR